MFTFNTITGIGAVDTGVGSPFTFTADSAIQCWMKVNRAGYVLAPGGSLTPGAVWSAPVVVDRKRLLGVR